MTDEPFTAPPPLAEWPLSAQILEVEREIKYRRTAYARWVREGKIKAGTASRQLSVMQSVLRTLRQLRETKDAPRQPGRDDP